MKKKILTCILTAAMVLSLAGCGGSSNTPSGSTGSASASGESTQQASSQEASAQEQTPIEGGVLKVGAAGSFPATLSYTQTRGIMQVAFLSYFYETLMRYGEDGTPECLLLESITPDSKALTWTMVVRDGVKFSDGSACDAEAVAWNLNNYKENGILTSSYFANFINAEATDEKTVVCHFSQWDALFDYSLCRTVLVASKKAFDDNGAEWLESNPVGTGPFIVKEYNQEVNLVMEKNPDYWQGRVYLDGVEVTYYGNELVEAASLQNGEIDCMVTEAYNIVEQIKAAVTPKVTAIPSYAYTLCFNCVEGDDPFTNVLVRQAASYAIDSNVINNTLTYGYGTVSNQWAVEGTSNYNPEVEGQPYNVEKAKSLLKEAGYENGFSTTLTFPSNEFTKNVASVIAQQLAQVGINVELRPIEGAAYVNYIGGWESGMLLHTMGYEAGAPSQYTTTFVNDISFGLGMNMFDITDELNTAAKAITTATTEEEKLDYTYKTAKMVFDDQCMAKVVLITSSVAFTNDNVKDGDFCGVQNYREDMWNAWIAK